jgi:hypothetical protein
MSLVTAPKMVPPMSPQEVATATSQMNTFKSYVALIADPTLGEKF